MKKLNKNQQDELNQKMAPVYRRIGALTFFVGLVALLAGLLLDRILQTKPYLTLGLILISAPILIWLNTRILRRQIEMMLKDIKTNQSKSHQ
jgi:uncharacterized membrane protein